MNHAPGNESGERSGVSPPVHSILYRQADACRSPILSLIGKTLRRIVATEIPRVAACDAADAAPRSHAQPVFLNREDVILAA